jgi:hypothetical protein
VEFVLQALDHMAWIVGRTRRDLTAPALLLVLAASGCGQGTVSNDDDVSRRAAERAVVSFLTAVHEGRAAAACAQIPSQQRGGLARLSASRQGPNTCAGALRTLREFAPVRAAGRLAIGHDIGFRSALPHRAKAAVDKVSVGGRPFGAIGLRRSGDVWRVAFVCDCP